MTTIAELRSALAGVPTVLLSPDDQRVLDDARTALDALERVDVSPTTVAVVGSSGSGKSMLVNALVGHEVAESGPIRPTTRRIAMIGGSGPVSLAAESEYVHVPTVRDGLVIIDTPPWEHDAHAVRSAIKVADLVVVVVTPSRYADAYVRDLVKAIPSRRPSTVVLNRIAVSGVDRARLATSVHERFGAEVVEIDEGADPQATIGPLIDRLEFDTIDYERATALRSAAAGSSRYVARRTAERAGDLADIARAVGRLPASHFERSELTVFEGWEATRRDLIGSVEASVQRVDDDVVRTADSELARRVRQRLEPWEVGDLARSLDAWRTATVDRFVAAARVRWRRAAALEILDRYAWKRAMNADVVVPPRMRRIMGSRLGTTAADAHLALVDVLEGPARHRAAQWQWEVDEVSEHAPGELLVLADGFDGDR